MFEYEDIIGLSHPVSSKRPAMPMADRAAQFSPFAALTGYDAVIVETARLTDRCIELDEGGSAMLNDALIRLQRVLHTQPQVTVTYFCPDARKTGGAYTRVTGRVKKIDLYEQMLVLTDSTSIPLEHIYEIDDTQCEYESVSADL